jgi:hypothetical protein
MNWPPSWNASVATYLEPIHVTGDFNIRLDRPDDPHADQLRLLVDCYRLVLHATGQTHQLSGTLGAVITHDVTGRPECVAVKDVGLCDHFLLRWEFSTNQDAPPFVAVRSRPWHRMDVELFRSALTTSRLCRLDAWPADIDEMAALYDDELNVLLDQLLPVRQYVRRPRPSDPWFDKECRDAKRSTRLFDRALAAASRRTATFTAASAVSTAASPDAVIVAAVAKAAAAKVAWYNQQHSYRQLRHRKCSEFWRGRLETDQSDPRKLWRSVDVLLGRGRVPASYALVVETFNRFFAEKVAKVRSSTTVVCGLTCRSGLSRR